ncbi:MAG: hypothetical protein ACP6IP_06590 [Candidatus Njordarchaeia archaeon]
MSGKSEVFVSLEVGGVYFVEARYGDSVKNVSVVLDPRVVVEKFFLIVFIYEENRSIAFINLFTSRPHIYGSNISTAIWVVDKDFKILSSEISVEFFRFYENGSILLEEKVSGMINVTEISLNRGYYLTKIKSSNDSITRIIQLGGEGSAISVLIDSTTGNIVGLDVYWKFTEKNPQGEFPLDTLILIMASIVLVVVLMVLYKRRFSY